MSMKRNDSSSDKCPKTAFSSVETPKLNTPNNWKMNKTDQA